MTTLQSGKSAVNESGKSSESGESGETGAGWAGLPPRPRIGGPESEPGVTGEAAGWHAPAAGDAADRHVRAGRGDVRVVLPDARVLGAGARRVQADLLQRQAEQVR